jgi:hypothetical protein
MELGVSATVPSNFALLDMTSTERGFLMPRMTTAQRDVIGVLGPESLLLYNTDALRYQAIVDSSFQSLAYLSDIAGVTLAAVGSTPNANGASLSSGVLNLQPASATHPGVVSTSGQSFAGTKSFDDVTVTYSTHLGGRTRHKYVTAPAGDYLVTGNDYCINLRLMVSATDEIKLPATGNEGDVLIVAGVSPLEETINLDGTGGDLFTAEGIPVTYFSADVTYMLFWDATLTGWVIMLK